MKVRQIFAVAGIAVVGLVGVAGTSSAATAHPAKGPAQTCVITSGSTHAGSGSGGIGVAVPATKAVPAAPAAKAVPATRVTKAAPVQLKAGVKGTPLMITVNLGQLVPAHKATGVCGVVTGPAQTVTIVPAHPVSGTPAQVTAPAKK